jgi:hypothetical protein
MKKALLLLLVALWGTFPLLSGEPYFCSRPGTRLHYERYKAKTNSLLQTTLFEIDSFDGSRVHYAVTMKKASGKELYGGRTLQTVTILPNGDLEIDFGQTLKGVVQNMFPGIKVAVSQSIGLLPEQMQPGDTLPDIHCTVKVTALSVTLAVTDRTVLRSERLATPVGVFDCMVVREHKQEFAPLHHLDNWHDNYYVPGLGYVRHDVYDKNMRLLESEVLVRIEESDAPPESSDGRP